MTHHLSGKKVAFLLTSQYEDSELTSPWDAVIEAGFTEARVRHHGDIARIEVPVADVARLAERGVRDAIVRGVLAAGYRYATLDLAGLQSGAFTLTVIGRRND